MIKKLIISILAVAVMPTAYAIEPIQPNGLLPTHIARPLLEQMPSVVSAKQGVNVGNREASVLKTSPYEWTPTASLHQRRYDGAGNSAEWQVGVSKTIRLPAKAEADKALGAAGVGEAGARYGEAMHEAATTLMSLWLDWLTAEQAQIVASKNMQSAQESIDVVEKRMKAGDASKLDIGLARTEWLELKRLHSEAQTNAEVAWNKLSTQFPSLSREVEDLPLPQALSEPVNAFREQIVSESDQIKTLKAILDKSKAAANRADAERTGDPTIGVYTASEARRTEQVIGVNFSIPLSGEIRETRFQKAQAEVEKAQAHILEKTRELEVAANGLYAQAKGSYNSWQLAKEGAVTIRDNAKLMQRAYELGEVDMQTLLLAKRQANLASHQVLQTQSAALRAYYQLLIDAHVVWDLARD